MGLSLAWECPPSPSALTFPFKDSFVFTGQPWAVHSAFGGQLCPGDCSCPFFRFWPRASGDRLNNHPGAPPESQDEEGQEALSGGREQAGGEGRGSSASCGFRGSSMVKCQFELKRWRLPESPTLPSESCISMRWARPLPRAHEHRVLQTEPSFLRGGQAVSGPTPSGSSAGALITSSVVANVRQRRRRLSWV